MLLRKFQESFLEDIFASGALKVREEISLPEEIIDIRFFTYINNVFQSLCDTLESTYPKVFEVLGEDVFKLLCKQFIHQHPARSGCLHHYSHKFPEFLRENQELHELPFLSELAMMEWKVHELRTAEDSPELDPTVIQNLSPEDLLQAKIEFPKGSIFLKVHYTLDKFFNSDAPEILERETFLLIARVGFIVNVFPLPAENYVFCKALYEEATLLEAFEKALEINPQFNLQSVLEYALNKKLFSRVIT